MRTAWVAAVVSLALAGEAVAQEGWTFSASNMPPPNQNCTALKTGPQVNTRLMRNGSDKMLLIAARGNWDFTDPVAAELSIDGAEPVFVFGLTVGPLVMVLIEDKAMEARLRAARTLDWRFPWGDFHAEVAGLGEAYDKVEICKS